MYIWLVGKTFIEHPNQTEAFKMAVRQAYLTAIPLSGGKLGFSDTWQYVGYEPDKVNSCSITPLFRPVTDHEA